MITIEQTQSPDLDTIFAELAALRAENQALRAKLPKTKRHSSTIVRAAVDAHAILCRAFAGDNTGCLAMQGEGMSKQRWAWAVAMLRYAGVVAYRNKQWRRGLEFVVTDLAEAIQQLEAGAGTLNTADGYKRLRGLLRKV